MQDFTKSTFRQPITRLMRAIPSFVESLKALDIPAMSLPLLIDQTP